MPKNISVQKSALRLLVLLWCLCATSMQLSAQNKFTQTSSANYQKATKYSLRCTNG